MNGNIDEKDRIILDLLQNHAEYTTRDVARKTGLPITTVHHRIKKLREAGVILKFTIEVDQQKVEKGLLAYILISANLSLLKQQKKSQHDLAREIKKFPFVERVDVVSGGTDLVAMVRVKDVQEFDQVLLGKLQLVEGVEKTQSLIVIHQG